MYKPVRCIWCLWNEWSHSCKWICTTHQSVTANVHMCMQPLFTYWRTEYSLLNYLKHIEIIWLHCSCKHALCWNLISWLLVMVVGLATLTASKRWLVGECQVCVDGVPLCLWLKLICVLRRSLQVSFTSCLKLFLISFTISSPSPPLSPLPPPPPPLPLSWTCTHDNRHTNFLCFLFLFTDWLICLIIGISQLITLLKYVWSAIIQSYLLKYN